MTGPGWPAEDSYHHNLASDASHGAWLFGAMCRPRLIPTVIRPRGDAMSDQSVDTVRGMYDAFGQGDVNAASPLEFFGADIKESIEMGLGGT